MQLTSIALLALLGVITYFATEVEATTDELPCVKKWGGPSPNNTIDDCEKFEEYVDLLISKLAVIIFPFLVAIFTWFIVPFMICSRYCCQCCGGSKMRPDECCCGSSHWDEQPEDLVMAQYGGGDLACARFFPFFLLICVVIYGAMAAAGVNNSHKGVDAVNQVFSNIVNWMVNLINKLIADSTNEITGKAVLNTSDFNDFLDTVQRLNKDWTSEDYQKWVRFSKEILSYIGYAVALPSLFVLLTLIAALARVRTCVPICNVCCMWLLVPVFGIVGMLFLGIHLPLDIVCYEVEAQLERKPSIVQYYFVPQCEKKSSLSKVQEEVDKKIKEYAELGCDNIKKICRNATGPSSTNMSKPFVCDYNIVDYPNNCSTVSQVQRFADSMNISAPGACSKSPCDLCECGNSCSNTGTYEGLKDDANEACVRMADAVAAVGSYNTNIKPLMSCNALMDKGVSFLKPSCDSLPKGIFLLGVSYSSVVITIVIAICTNFRGQKRWFTPPANNWDPSDGQQMAPMAAGAGHYDQPGVQYQDYSSKQQPEPIL